MPKFSRDRAPADKFQTGAGCALGIFSALPSQGLSKNSSHMQDAKYGCYDRSQLSPKPNEPFDLQAFLANASGGRAIST